MIAAGLALLTLLSGEWAAPRPAIAAPAQSLVRGTIAARVEFRVHSGLILVPVRVNGSRDLRMYLDTGMSAPVVVLFHKESLEELGLEGGQQALVAGAGADNRKPATVARGATVAVGPLEMTDQTLVVLGDSRETSDWPVDGIIGKTLFDKYIAEVDYEANTVTFYDPAGAKVEAPAAPIPIDLADGMPVIEAAVDIEGARRIPLRMVVDLGHRNALSLSEDYAKGIRPPKRHIEAIAGRGIQGEIPGKLGRVKRLELGEHLLTDVPADFLAPETNAGVSRARVDANLGSLALSRFRVVLDYRGRRMFLVPNASFGRPIPVNMAGLVLEQDRGDALVARHVIKGSPAAKKGLRAGDTITAINGRDAREFSYGEVLAVFGEEGRTLRLTVARGGERLEFKVKLKRMI